MVNSWKRHSRGGGVMTWSSKTLSLRAVTRYTTCRSISHFFVIWASTEHLQRLTRVRTLLNISPHEILSVLTPNGCEVCRESPEETRPERLKACLDLKTKQTDICSLFWRVPRHLLELYVKLESQAHESPQQTAAHSVLRIVCSYGIKSLLELPAEKDSWCLIPLLIPLLQSNYSPPSLLQTRCVWSVCGCGRARWTNLRGPSDRAFLYTELNNTSNRAFSRLLISPSHHWEKEGDKREREREKSFTWS